MERIKIGRRVIGFMCIRSEPYPYGEGECIPLYGPVERLPEEPDIKKQSLQEWVNEAQKMMDDE